MAQVACTLIMKSTFYMPGILALGHSWKKYNRTPIICMVTPDVPELAVAAIGEVFDRVVHVDYIYSGAKWNTTQKINSRYGSWADVACTKWNILRLVEYRLVYFIDADIVIAGECEDAFNLRPPAAIFSSPFGNKSIPCGDTVSPAELSRALRNGHTVACGSNVLVAPSMHSYNAMLSVLNKGTSARVHNGRDEIVLCQTYVALRESFTVMHPRYGWMCGKYAYLEGARPIGYHYYNVKPWDYLGKRWEDWAVYEGAASECLAKHPCLKYYLHKDYIPLFCVPDPRRYAF